MTATVQPRPEAAPPRPFHFPRFAQRRLDNGLDVIVAPVPRLPMITVALVCDAGAATETPDAAGVAQLAARALLEGTHRSDGGELTDRFERLGVSVDSVAEWDASVLYLSALSGRFPPVMELLAEVVMEPAFARRDVERLRAERLSEILQLRAEPRGLADDMFTRVLYHPASRFALPLSGGTETVGAITPELLRAFHAARYRPAGSTLVIVGDVEEGSAMEVAARVFGEWRGGQAPAVAVDDTPARPARASHLVVRPDAAQSEVRIGHVGLPRRHPDYFAVLVMNALLGGLFSSRINLNLRERNGYTYGAFSGYDWRRSAGPFAVSTAVAGDVTGPAAAEVLREIDGMRDGEVREEELTLATSYLAGVFPIRYETTGAMARALAAMRIYGLPGDYFDTYREKVLAVTPADVLRAARQHLHPEALQLLVVGDATAVRAPLEALGCGPLAVYDAEGRPMGTATGAGRTA